MQGKRLEIVPNEKVFVENSSYARHLVKRRILRYKLISYICGICDSPPAWRGKPMPLVLDHINGTNNDNRLENLRFVCSNCDSQLETYKSRNKKLKRSTYLAGDASAALKAAGACKGQGIDTATTPPIKCPKCERMFASERAIRSHNWSAHTKQGIEHYRKITA
jgi:hypothetical protein